MPLYDLTCPTCEMDSEHLMGMNDNLVLIKCPGCGEKMTRQKHKKYAGMKIQIQGDTVAGGCTYDYYDENLECHITSKQHRQREMDRQGLQEYTPDPVQKAHRDEQAYVKRNSSPGDADAAKAIRREKKAAIKKRQRAAVDRAFDKVPMPSLPGLGE